MPPIVLHVPENPRAMQPIIGASKQTRNPWACLLHQMKAFPPAGTFPLKTQPPASKPMVRSRPKPVCVNPTGKKQRGSFTRMQSSRFANAKTVTVNTLGVQALPRIKPSWVCLMWPVSARLTCFPLGFMWLFLAIFGIIGLTLPCSCRSMC